MNIDAALILARAAKAVYLKPSEAENWATDAGFETFDWFEAEDTQVAVMETERQCVVVFRGTTNVHDWLTNVDLWQTDWIYGKAHSGFVEALNVVWDDIEGAGRGKTLFVAGHSLGGALATLAVSRYCAGRLYTFGSPRVFDKEAAEKFDKNHRSYRFVNNNDIVPRVPIGYQHIGTLHHFTHKGKMWKDPHWGWIEVDRIIGRLKSRVDGIRDHNMDRYISCVSRVGTRNLVP